MRGHLEMTEIDAPALRGNPLGDQARRPVLVYLPPGYPRGDARHQASLSFLLPRLER